MSSPIGGPSSPPTGKGVSILCGRWPCDKMAETCEENLIEIEDILQVTEGEQNDAECETILTEEPMVG